MGPYSVDLRQRIVDAYRNGEGSMREVAARFTVALSTVQEYLNRERASKIDEAGSQHLRALADEKNDRTLDGLIELLERRTVQGGPRRHEACDLAHAARRRGLVTFEVAGMDPKTVVRRLRELRVIATVTPTR